MYAKNYNDVSRCRKTSSVSVSLCCIPIILTFIYSTLSAQVNDHVHRFKDFEDQRGRVTSTTRLSWDPPAHFIKGVAHVECHAIVGGHTTTATKEIYLDPASSAAFNHQYASAGTDHLQI